MLIGYILYVLSGFYMAYKVEVGFEYVMHKNYTNVCPLVKSPDDKIIPLLFLAFLIGPFVAFMMLMVMGFDTTDTIKYSDLWTAKVGESYNLQKCKVHSDKQMYEHFFGVDKNKEYDNE